jgi:hypothetical protein
MNVRPNGEQFEGHEFACVPPMLIDGAILLVRGMLKRGQEAGGQVYDEVSTIIDLKSGRLLLWVAYRANQIDAALLTRLVRGPDGLVCCLIAIGGRGLKCWLHFLREVETYARAEGCVKVRLEGRVGWTRILADYVQTGVILERRIG